MSDVPEIDIAGLDALGDAVTLVDVRNPDEYERGHLPGAALLPMAEIPDRVAELPAEGPVYLVCATGARSHRVAAYLRGLGVDAINVAGGTRAWAESGRPIREGGQP